MDTRRQVRRHGAREVALGGLTWGILLVILLATTSVPELGGWPDWLWTDGR